MNTLHHLSFLYPNAVAIAGILIAFVVVYFAGKALAWVFSSTEKKVEPEPSVMTELDELRMSNERISTMYDNISSQTQSYDRMIRIAELEKELSDLRSSCDDSFINTVDRANKLSMKCASLENTIAEFDVYKKDAQEVHDKLTKLYDAEVATKKDLSSKLWRSRREVASLKRDLISATAQIAEIGEKYSSAERERSEYESMYNSILAQYAELRVKLNAIEQAK